MIEAVDNTIGLLLDGADARDAIQQAFEAEAGKRDRRNPHAVALGALGAAKGGKATASHRSKAQRLKVARHAADVRWRHRED